MLQVRRHSVSPAGCSEPVSDAAFLDEVRSFLDTQLTPELREAGRNTVGVHSEIVACRTWHRRLYERGWIVPAWPVAHGGTGWDAARRFLFEQECARNDAPVLFATGLRSIGPLIIARGTENQKRRYLRRILSGDDLWCQGFSESQAGSDLAAITTRADRRGDHYVVRGRKLWTTGAHLANRMFALVRTKTCDKTQLGITFLLIDMDTPGISVRPIVTIDGAHEFNEVWFDEVVVPTANRIGAEDEGWAEAKHLMRFARTNNTNASLLRRTWRMVERALNGLDHDDHPLRRKVAQTEAELVAFESLELKYLSTGRLTGDDEASASVMKLAATELHQRLTELLLDIAGPFAIAPGIAFASAPLRAGGFAMRKYLATRAASIYSGTSEIHRNLIAGGLIGRFAH